MKWKAHSPPSEGSVHRWIILADSKTRQLVKCGERKHGAFVFAITSYDQCHCKGVFQRCFLTHISPENYFWGKEMP